MPGMYTMGEWEKMRSSDVAFPGVYGIIGFHGAVTGALRLIGSWNSYRTARSACSAKDSLIHARALSPRTMCT